MLRTIIREYTREAGVRSLERRLADVCRKAATQVAKGKAQKPRIDEKKLREWLGPPHFSGEVRKRTSAPGVATGLAYTAAGGDVLFIEAAAYPGKGNLTVTGQLGDVMQESARAALSWVRSHSDQLGVEPEWFSEHDLHIHVPAGAVPKDGPSAGVTMATAIASLVRNEPVAEDVGMTGEITLTGQVLPIGGIREKSLAAQRAGLKRVILPRENEAELIELPPETREAIEFIPADTIEDVFAAAFSGKAVGARPAGGRPSGGEEPQRVVGGRPMRALAACLLAAALATSAALAANRSGGVTATLSNHVNGTYTLLVKNDPSAAGYVLSFTYIPVSVLRIAKGQFCAVKNNKVTCSGLFMSPGASDSVLLTIASGSPGSGGTAGTIAVRHASDRISMALW